MGQQSGRTLALDWSLPQRRTRVFAALTEPDQLARWWGPHGFSVPELVLDLRPGGAYRIAMQPPEGDPFHLEGAFVEVDPPRRLSFTFNWDPPHADDRETRVTLTLEEAEDGTLLSLVQGPFATEERVALHRQGWAESVARLRTLLGAGHSQ